ncbi:MAG: VWA domain-containing protein [Treponema sp.]|jgi:uncharacterized protein YegL|nr:VWA domain-containing protein [Treponema sp.]
MVERMSLTSKIEIPKRTQPLFFVIDTSESMHGSKIGMVNTAMKGVIPVLKELSDDNPDVQIKIAVLSFSSGAKWIAANGLGEPDNFLWDDLISGGTCELGAAFKSLNKNLSHKAFMQEANGFFVPAIFLMSGGEPVDDWQSGLNQLKQNNWFKAAVKVAVAIGESADKEALKEFTGMEETVLTVHNSDVLEKVIRFACMCVCQVGVHFGEYDEQKEFSTVLHEFAEKTAINPVNDQWE